MVGGRHAFDHRQLAQPSIDFAHGPLGILQRVADAVRVDADHDEIVAGKADPFVQACHGLHEQAGADQQDQREGQLADHEQLADAHAAGQPCAGPFLQRGHQRNLPGLHHWGEAADDPRHDAGEEREDQDARHSGYDSRLPNPYVAASMRPFQSSWTRRSGSRTGSLRSRT